MFPQTIVKLSFFFVCILCITTTGESRPTDPQNVTTYDVDLLSDPKVRWNKVLDDYKKYIAEILAGIRTFVPTEYLSTVEEIALDIENLIPSPFAQEIIGISQYTNVSLADAILLNVLYDATAYCTSIVGQDSNGKIWHGRNLDYVDGDVLRNITVAVNFKLGNKTLYSATTYAGYVGILTGMRPGNFSISVNQRGIKGEHDGKWWYNILLAILDTNSSFVSFLVRQTLETVSDFTQAVFKLSSTIIHAPAYIIVGGVHKGEGVIITRDRIFALNRYYMNPLQQRWYVLETNYDHWLQPPPTDSQRRAVGIREMDKLGPEGLNGTSLYNVLSTVPVLNKHTTYTTVMSARQGIFQTRIRWPPSSL